MKAYKSRQLYSKIAEDLNHPETLVSDVVNFYYEKVREEIGGLNHTSLKIVDLGTLEIRKGILQRYKLREKNVEENFLKNPDFSHYKSVKENLIKINKLLEELKEEEQRKMLTKNKRDEFINKNLEK
jgi:nucleoid DNA-binding protein